MFPSNDFSHKQDIKLYIPFFSDFVFKTKGHLLSETASLLFIKKMKYLSVYIKG